MRVSVSHLRAQANYLNKITNSPASYAIEKDGKRVIQVGHWHISRAYGGFDLYRTANEGGAVNDVFRCGHIPARELSGRISALIMGIESKN